MGQYQYHNYQMTSSTITAEKVHFRSFSLSYSLTYIYYFVFEQFLERFHITTFFKLIVAVVPQLEPLDGHTSTSNISSYPLIFKCKIPHKSVQALPH